MKSFLINIGIVIVLILAYYIDFFGWFTSKYALLGSFAIVVVILTIALKVLGNPFKKEDDDENK